MAHMTKQTTIRSFEVRVQERGWKDDELAECQIVFGAMSSMASECAAKMAGSPVADILEDVRDYIEDQIGDLLKLRLRLHADGRGKLPVQLPD